MNVHFSLFHLCVVFSVQNEIKYNFYLPEAIFYLIGQADKHLRFLLGSVRIDVKSAYTNCHPKSFCCVSV